jgi:hypothetical protein
MIEKQGDYNQNESDHFNVNREADAFECFRTSDPGCVRGVAFTLVGSR